MSNHGFGLRGSHLLLYPGFCRRSVCGWLYLLNTHHLMDQIEQQLSNFDFQRWFLMQRCNPNYIPPAWKESCVSAHIASWRGRRKKLKLLKILWSFCFFVIKAVFVACMNFACAGLRELWCAGVCGKLGRWMCFHTTCFAKYKKVPITIGLINTIHVNSNYKILTSLKILT